MTLKLLQLNINADNYLTSLFPYLTSNTFDVIQFQEVTGKNTVNGNINSQVDVYEELQKILSPEYKSELSISTRYSSDPINSYMGNATFYKKEFLLQAKQILTLYKSSAPFPSEVNHYEDVGRTVLHLELVIQGKRISFINAHLAWAKTSQEEPHQTHQGEIFLTYLKTVPAPFILTGDFNLDPHQPTIQKITKLARNLTDEYHISNTLNPRTHRAKELFPKGVAVDYICISSDLTVKNFSVVQEDISDHLGLTTEIEI
jgi:endonuclease/exonuclease/phosphatase family metal-dependent hydrolase